MKSTNIPTSLHELAEAHPEILQCETTDELVCRVYIIARDEAIKEALELWALDDANRRES